MAAHFAARSVPQEERQAPERRGIVRHSGLEMKCLGQVLD